MMDKEPGEEVKHSDGMSNESGGQGAQDSDNDESQWSDVSTSSDEERSSEKKKLKIDVTESPKGSPKKRRKRIENLSVPDDVQNMDTKEFEEAIERGAKKMNWNRGQVKTFIRKVIESPDIVNLVLEQAGDLPASSSNDKSVSETKWTRKKAKKVTEGGQKLPWILEKIQQHMTQLSSKKNEEVSFFAAELPDDDDEDDQEYDPSKDPEGAALFSDEDSLATQSEHGSQTPNQLNLTPTNQSSAKSEDKGNSSVRDSNDIFKLPSSGIDPDSNPKRVNRCLNFDRDSKENQAERRRITRSKASLKDVPIEELEKQFVPPDVTPDMYDIEELDDNDIIYTEFLHETYFKPVQDSGGNSAREENQQDDPDYNYFQDDDGTEVVDANDEFRFDKSTMIPRKEVDDLINELIHDFNLAADQDRSSAERAKRTKAHEAAVQRLKDSYYEDIASQETPELTVDQMTIVAHQMRQHIQLLTQMTLLTSKTPTFSKLNNDCKRMTAEIIGTSANKSDSFFGQERLMPSVTLVDRWEHTSSLPYIPSSASYKVRAPYDLSDDLVNLMADSTCFPYPELLPEGALRLTEDQNKNIQGLLWSESEDLLLALGLERYATSSRKPKSNSDGLLSKSVCDKIATNLLVTKSREQVYKRIKNQKLRRASDMENPITYFFTNLKAPPLRLDYDNFMFVSSLDQRLRDVPPGQLSAKWRELLRLQMMVPIETRKSRKPKESQETKFQQNENQSNQEVVHLTFLPNENSLKRIEPLTMPVFEQPKTPEKHNEQMSKSISNEVDNNAGKEIGNKSAMQHSLKKQRERILRKYSPMKQKSKNTLRNKLSKLQSTKKVEIQDSKQETQSSNVSIISQELHEHPDSINETICEENDHDNAVETGQAGINSTLCNIISHAMEESGIVSPIAKKQINKQQELLSSPVASTSSPSVPPPPLLTTGSPSLPKRKSKLQKEAEQTFNMLEDETETEKETRRLQEANELINFAEQTLSAGSFDAFLQVLADNEDNSKFAFLELHKLCGGFPSLQEMLLDLLEPPDAVELGNEVYNQFAQRSQIKKFFRKLRVYYDGQPALYTRILKELSSQINDSDLNCELIKSIASKYFKSNPHLYDSFLGLMPQIQTPSSLLPDPELILLNSEATLETASHPENLVNASAIPKVSDMEKIEADFLNSDLSADIGGDNCVCKCHIDENDIKAQNHCIHCSLVFLNNRAFIREGKSLKPVQLEYAAGQENPFALQKRKASQDKSKRTRKSFARANEDTAETSNFIKEST